MSLPLVLLALWLAAAFAAVLAGALAHLPPPALLVPLALAAFAVTWIVPSLRAAALRADLRTLLLPHFARFVGVVFIVRVAHGTLDPVWGPIGWGDAIAAAGASALLLVGPPSGPRDRLRWWAWLLWSAQGLADMALLAVTALRLGLSAPERVEEFRHLPFGLLPTYFVPLIIASHALILLRLFRLRGAGAEAGPARR